MHNSSDGQLKPEVPLVVPTPSQNICLFSHTIIKYFVSLTGRMYNCSNGQLKPKIPADMSTTASAYTEPGLSVVDVKCRDQSCNEL